MKIKGNEYMTVNERLQIFRAKHSDYTLQTNWLVCDKDIAIAKAMILDKEGRIISEGTAMERQGDSLVNKTSHIENCETSAWGRALANFGIGIDNSVASAEEVENALSNQAKSEDQYIPSAKVDRLWELVEAKKLDSTDILAFLSANFGLFEGKLLSSIIEYVKDKTKLEAVFAKKRVSTSSKYFDLLLEWGREL